MKDPTTFFLHLTLCQCNGLIQWSCWEVCKIWEIQYYSIHMSGFSWGYVHDFTNFINLPSTFIAIGMPIPSQLDCLRFKALCPVWCLFFCLNHSTRLYTFNLEAVAKHMQTDSTILQHARKLFDALTKCFALYLFTFKCKCRSGRERHFC